MNEFYKLQQLNLSTEELRSRINVIQSTTWHWLQTEHGLFKNHPDYQRLLKDLCFLLHLKNDPADTDTIMSVFYGVDWREKFPKAA